MGLEWDLVFSSSSWGGCELSLCATTAAAAALIRAGAGVHAATAAAAGPAPACSVGASQLGHAFVLAAVQGTTTFFLVPDLCSRCMFRMYATQFPHFAVQPGSTPGRSMALERKDNTTHRMEKR